MFEIPARQKICLNIIGVTGILLSIFIEFDLFKPEVVRICLFAYGFAIPFVLLMSNLILDLNQGKVFLIWSMLGMVFLTIYFVLREKTEFFMRGPDLKNSLADQLISNTSVSSLKALPFFLVGYLVVNWGLKQLTNTSIVNTYKQHKWYHSEAKRKITWLDVLSNVILFGIIFLGIFLKL